MLQQRLANQEVMILDGAMGSELQRRGVPMHGKAWCGVAMLTHPDVVRAIHEDYIRAGADVIITNTFATGRHVLSAAGLEDRVRDINASAVRLAQMARHRVAAGRQVWIAGSISTMAPGADKHRRPSVEQMRVSLQEQAETLAAEGVDLIVLEMMRDVTYSIAAVQAAVGTGLPVWVGFSCSQRTDGSVILHPATNGDIFLQDALGPVMQQGGSLVAVMHSEINEIRPALMQILAHWQGPVGAYPHSGSFEMPHWQFVDIITPEALLEEAMQWVALGAQVIGGCCGIGPEHIRLLKERLPTHLPS